MTKAIKCHRIKEFNEHTGRSPRRLQATGYSTDSGRALARVSVALGAHQRDSATFRVSRQRARTGGGFNCRASELFISLEKSVKGLEVGGLCQPEDSTRSPAGWEANPEA